MRDYDIDSARLIHALQNHDELTGGLAHFGGAHAAESFDFRGTQRTGREVRDLVHQEMYEHLIGTRAPYNMKFGDGVACTTATVITAALGIRDIYHLKPAQIERIKHLHLLLAFYNAMQPGVFALSGWDLVGALTLPPQQVRERLADGDTRWINRGSYDLLGSNPDAHVSAAGLPRAVALYGAIPAQLGKPDSFASQLARLLRARAQLRLQVAQLVDVPAVQSAGLLVLVHELPEHSGTEVTAINFAAKPVDETITLQGIAAGSAVTDVLNPGAPKQLGSGGTLHLHLDAYEGQALLIGG
jgi:trehalose synthase